MLIASVGAGYCFAVNAVSFTAAVAALLLMRAEELLPLDRGGLRTNGVEAIREGVAFVRRAPGLRLILLMTAVVGIAGFNFRVSLPVLASGTLHHGAGLFGLLYASFGVGALAGSLVAAAAGRADLEAPPGGDRGLRRQRSSRSRRSTRSRPCSPCGSGSTPASRPLTRTTMDPTQLPAIQANPNFKVVGVPQFGYRGIVAGVQPYPGLVAHVAFAQYR